MGHNIMEHKTCHLGVLTLLNVLNSVKHASLNVIDIPFWLHWCNLEPRDNIVVAITRDNSDTALFILNVLFHYNVKAHVC